MKKLALFLIFVSIFQIAATSQSHLSARADTDGNDSVGQACLPEGIIFTTQAQIDSFQINYPGCTEIEGDVSIKDYINNLNGLSVLTAIGGSLKIDNNSSLTNLTGLENLNSIGGNLFLMSNDALTSLTGLDHLTIIEGSLDINWCDLLSSLAALNNLTSIGDNLSIYGCYNLTNLYGLVNINYIGGYIFISETSLINLTGLENITSIPGYLQIGWYEYQGDGGNPYLTSLTGLNNLTSIGGKLHIENNSKLSTLTALNNLSSINGDLLISSIDSLTNLTGMEALTTISGGLWISHNAALKNLTGIENIEGSSIQELYIMYNTSLMNCAIQSICDYIASPDATVGIHDNAPGCNSPEEVLDSCVVSVKELKYDQEVSTHPNPFPTSTTIEYELAKSSTVQLTIYDYLGKKVEVMEENQQQGKQQITWNAEGLPAGVYFCVLKTNQGSQTTKLIKL